MRTVCTFFMSVLAISTTALGGTLHDIDVILEVVDGQITTNRVISGIETEPERVFDADAISFFGNIVTDDPGFNAVPGAFPAFTVMSLDLAAPLRLWNGDGFDVVDPAHYLELEFNNQTAQSPMMDGEVVTGPLMNATQFGDIHNHADHFLFVDQAPGIYMGTLRFSSDTLEDSENFYFVYRWEPTSGDIDAAEVEQQAAIQWVRDNVLADACPADFDDDGAVGSTDLAALLAAWGNPGADLDGDGTTGAGDLAALLAAWGACD